MIRIVGVGGGTGLPVLLRGLRVLSRAEGVEMDVSAVVCVSDNGGSSGLLRQAFGIPAVGDLRNCLVGLSEDNALLADLFQYRFSAGDGLAGHALGNLILIALYQRAGSLRAAIQAVADLLRLQGRIFPATEDKVTLCARFSDGTLARGECEIASARRPIERIWLEPEGAQATEEALQSIASADAIVLGPGSLYTSVLPNLLAAGVAEAIRCSPAVKIFPCNLMTQPGETEGFSPSEHLRAIEDYLGPGALDFCLMNSARMDPALERGYRESGASPVRPDPVGVARRGVIPVCADLLSAGVSEARHDPGKLAHLVLSLTRERASAPVSLGTAKYALRV